MPWRIIWCFFVLFVVANAQKAIHGRRQSSLEPKEMSNSLIDIDLYNSVDQGEEVISGSGSGTGDLLTDDEDLGPSGSGSGGIGGGATDLTGATVYTNIKHSTRPTVQTTTPAPLRTPCQQLREASKHLLGTYVPRCTVRGDYDSLQCRGHQSTGSCWCADLGGREIPGTTMTGPNYPDCENGKNLAPCVLKLVQFSRSGLLGTFRPRCTIDGNFDFKQCSGSMCFCVDKKTGVKVPGTEVYMPDEPKCDEKPDISSSSTAKTTMPITQVTTTSVERTEAHPQHTSRLHTTPPKEEEKEKNLYSEEDEEEGNEERETLREPSSAAHVMTQPGILAAIIGGSVVLLLCAILLVMFVVYRMRKKDEGSYALDEPRKIPNYSYQRAPDKEFYA